MPSTIDMSQVPESIAKTCPRCGTSAQGRVNVDSVFGFRNMPDPRTGIINVRPQSYCRGCRLNAPAGVRARRQTARTITVNSTLGGDATFEQVTTLPAWNVPDNHQIFNHIAAIGVEMEGGYTRALPVDCKHEHDASCVIARTCGHNHIQTSRSAETCAAVLTNESRCRCCSDNHLTYCYAACTHEHTESCSQCNHDCRRPSGYGAGNPCMGHQTTDGSIHGVQGNAWELRGHRESMSALRQFIDAYHPDSVNSSCGIHVHVSLKDERLFDVLLRHDFTEFFRRRVGEWRDTFNSQRSRNALSGRLDGSNQYCRLNTPYEIEHHRTTGTRAGGYNGRYRIINYCMAESRREHGTGTVEFRVFHGMKDPNAIMQAVKIVYSCVEEYLDLHTPADRNALRIF